MTSRPGSSCPPSTTSRSRDSSPSAATSSEWPRWTGTTSASAPTRRRRSGASRAAGSSPALRRASRPAFTSSPIGPDGDLRPLRAAAERPERLLYLAVPASAFTSLARGLGARRAGGRHQAGDREALRSRRRARPAGSTPSSTRSSPRSGSTGSTTTSGRRRSRTCWSSASATRSSSGCGIATRSRGSRSPSPKSLGVEHRGAFYEETGAIRDIVQNHMFQLLAVTAMEPPISFEAEAIRNEKVKVLEALHPVNPGDVVRGQYAAGTVDGEPVPGYREEEGVDRGLGGRDLRGPAPPHQLLALGRRALPAPHRQASRGPGQPGGAQLPGRPSAPLPRGRPPRPGRQPAGGPGAARRGDLGDLRRQASRSGGDHPAGRDGLQLRGLVQGEHAGGVRAAAPRRAERRPHPLHPRGRGGSRLEGGPTGPRPASPVKMYPAGSWGPAAANRIARPGHWHDGSSGEPRAAVGSRSR